MNEPTENPVVTVVKGLVRPVVTVAFVGALIIGTLVDTNVENIKDPALMIVAYWFGTRK